MKCNVCAPALYRAGAFFGKGVKITKSLLRFARTFRITRRGTMADLTDATRAKIAKAFQSKDAADAASTAHDSSATALTAAQRDEHDKLEAAATAHEQAATDAHEALAAVAADLGFPLDNPTPPSPPPASTGGPA